MSNTEAAIDKSQHDYGNIFNVLEMTDDYQQHKPLFMNQQEMIPTQIVDRIKFILRLYAKWINIKLDNAENEPDDVMDIHDIIDTALSSEYGIAQFISDYRYIVNDNRQILPYHDEDVNTNTESDLDCDIDNCYLANRINRNRLEMSRYNNRVNALFFVNDNK